LITQGKMPVSASSQEILTGLTGPIRVGLVGTGYAAKLRAQTLQDDSRSQLTAVVGHTLETLQEFCQTYQAQAEHSWQSLIERDDLDLIIVSNVSRDHGIICRAALETGKHVVVEYPLALEPTDAENLIALATHAGKLLHIEHIELLGGVHNALIASLNEVGAVAYVRYCTIASQNPAPRKWTYQPALFGFPLISALSRIHRLTSLFGQVATVRGQSRFWDSSDPEFFRGCLCTAHLQFVNGILADVIYGKGEPFTHAERRFEVHGEKGTLIFEGETGHLIRGDEKTSIEVGTRRGLFAKDTTMVLDHLLNGTELYVTPAQSLYSLKVAEAARLAAITGQTMTLTDL
jgi:biliverdin reductase